MKITIVGTGYVGLVTGTCLANLGHDVICLDIDETKIENLNKGIIPIYEPGLTELVKRNVKEGRISFSTNPEKSYEASEVIFIAVGTPSSDTGEADLRAVWAVAKDIGKYMNGYKVVVDKSTVPIGTADKVRSLIKENMQGDYDFDVVSNPEFLKEGMAIQDFQIPDRIVVGCETEKAKEYMEQIYRDVARTTRPIMFTDVKSAELIKYASNAMLATRISFMNQLSGLCDKVGADIKQVAKGMGLDSRIGHKFLQAGVGYGGSCFPKDVQALAATLKEEECDFSLFDAVEEINKKQKLVAVNKLESEMDVKGKTIAIWGISFKPKTDDIRDAPSLDIIKKLQEKGAKINAFDPIAMDNAKERLSDINFTSNSYDALKNADALILVTEWDEFRNPDFDKMKELMNNPLVIDGRNIYNPKFMKEKGFTYLGIGRN